MCGICGIHNPSGVEEQRLRMMAAALRHRGPDGEGFHTDGPIGLGHRRLAIIDLEHGAQPLCNEDRSVWVVCNGEIYNYRELSEELRRRGHVFATNSDCEPIAHLYEEHGAQFVRYLEGMFAIAIWDARAKRLVLARDRLGQKPLFYKFDGERLLFASEIKGILAEPVTHADLDPIALHGYLGLRFVPSPYTMFQDIRSLPPAHVMVFENGEPRLERYWDIRYLPKWEESEEQLADRLDALMREAVTSHLVSDVPVGLFLSGGIDSSLVTAYAAEELGPGVPTFSIGSNSASFNELPYARIVAGRFETDSHERVVDPDLITLLPQMVHNLDMPGDPIAACQFHVAQLGAEHVKVVLGGDGGDEIFGGYDRLAAFKLVTWYSKLPEIVRERLVQPVVNRLPNSFRYKSVVEKLRWANALSYSRGGQRYAEATTYFRFDSDRLASLYGPLLRERLLGEQPAAPIVAAFEAADADELLDRMLYVDLTTRLPEHLLLILDRMTMARSLEARSPMLDHKLVEFAGRLPAHLKVRRLGLKVLQRRVAKRYLPPEITGRRKQGFMFPIAGWLKNELRHAARDLLLGSRLIDDGWFEREGIAVLLDEHVQGRVDHHHRLWMLLNLDLWYRRYLCGESVEGLSERLRERVEIAELVA